LEIKPAKISTLKNIYKEIRFCDSLKVAYSKKSDQLNLLIDSNLILFSNLEDERKKRKLAEDQVHEINKKFEKNKTSNAVKWGAAGVGVGVLIGAIIR
jgi:hypothetical protein